MAPLASVNEGAFPTARESMQQLRLISLCQTLPRPIAIIKLEHFSLSPKTKSDNFQSNTTPLFIHVCFRSFILPCPLTENMWCSFHWNGCTYCIEVVEDGWASRSWIELLSVRSLNWKRSPLIAMKLQRDPSLPLKRTNFSLFSYISTWTDPIQIVRDVVCW